MGGDLDYTFAWLEWRQLIAPATRNFFHLFIASAFGFYPLRDLQSSAFRGPGSEAVDGIGL
jgi:hypothetical protein